MLPFHRRFRRGFYALLARGLLAGAQWVPAPVGRFGGRVLARGGLALMRRERGLARSNIERVFGVGDPDRNGILLKQATTRLGENFFDALTVERRQRASFSDVDGAEALEALRTLQAEGHGVLVLTGHFGCWELLGAWLADVMDGLTVVTGRIHNPPVDRLINDRRRRLGLSPVPRDGDLRPLIRRLREGGVAAVLMDQNTRVENRDVPFFGVAAPTALGFASLARGTKAPVLPLAIARSGDGHKIVHLPPLRSEESEGHDHLDVFLAACNRALETLILRNPIEWVWFHQRWPNKEESKEEPES